jgi:NTE family protein
MTHAESATTSPVRMISGDEDKAPRPGIALCLSGGGYRAMVFHLGALWRLNELGFFPKLKLISSVSGGSITAGVLGMRWGRLNFNPASGIAAAYQDEVVAPICAMAQTTIDVGDVLKGIFLPGTVAGHVAQSYRRHLFGTATLQDLPDAPQFVINATNVQSGVLWRFSKPYMEDWKVGVIPDPKVELALAVGASSAFPPVLSPARLDLNPNDFTPGTGSELQILPYTTQAILTDGGVYDNLGLETAWKHYDTILESATAAVISYPSVNRIWIGRVMRSESMISLTITCVISANEH